MHSTVKGIVQSGGAINATNIVAGDHATIHNDMAGTNAQVEQVQTQLQRLMDLLTEQGHVLPNQTEVLQSTQAAREELSKEKPNKLTVRSLLSGIAESVQSVGTIATAVEGLKVAVGILLG